MSTNAWLCKYCKEEIREDALVCKYCNRSQKRTLLPLFIVFSIVIIAGILYLVSPFLTCYRLSEAIKNKDSEAISAMVDFASLRESIKSQLMEKANAKAPAEDSPWAKLGMLIGMSMVGSIVDRAVSPSGIIAIYSGKPLAEKAQKNSDGLYEIQVNEVFEIPAPINEAMTYKDIDHFIIKRGSSAIKLTRRGLLNWQVTSIELPPDQEPLGYVPVFAVGFQSNSPAKEKIQKWDQLRAIDGIEVKAIDHLIELVAKSNCPKVTVLRDGEKLDFSIPLRSQDHKMGIFLSTHLVKLKSPDDSNNVFAFSDPKIAEEFIKWREEGRTPEYMGEAVIAHLKVNKIYILRNGG